MCSVSVRKGIKWGHGDFEEPTSTLVLQTPRTWFIDIRIVTSTGELDWGFAGTTTSSTRKDGSGNEITHKIFHHWVDNRTEDPDFRDAGDMHPVDERGIVKETGRMVNPANGEMMNYEEFWRDLELESGNGDENVAFVVWQTQDDASRLRGMILRVGRYGQAVLRHGDAFTCQRWDFAGDRWRRSVMIGTDHIPFEAALGADGDTLTQGDIQWTRIESDTQ